MSALTRTVLALAVGAAGLAGRADDRLIPADLSDAQKANLKKGLAAVEKPKRFVPERARIVGNTPDGLDLDPAPGAEVKEYLASVVPHAAADRKKGPEKADLYWYRPNPKKGLPGITVRRTVDLTTGELAGGPEVLFNHATPLAPEERDEAVALARKKVPAVAELYDGAEEKEVEVAALVQVLTAAGQPDGAVGDRVVSLQFRKKDAGKGVTVMVNLTRQSARDPNAP